MINLADHRVSFYTNTDPDALSSTGLACSCGNVVNLEDDDDIAEAVRQLHPGEPTLEDRQRAALGLLVEHVLDALPKIKAQVGAEYTLMPGAVLLIGRTFGPFHEGDRWSDDPQMPVMQSAALIDRLDAWHAGRWPAVDAPEPSISLEPFRVDLGQALGEADAMRWDGSMESQSKIVTWTNAAVSGWHGSEGSPTGEGRNFLRCRDTLYEVGDVVVRRAGTDGPYSRISSALWDQMQTGAAHVIIGPLAQVEVEEARALLDAPDMEDRS